MRRIKNIFLFLVYPAMLLGIGIYVGVTVTHFFYPGEQAQEWVNERSLSSAEEPMIQKAQTADEVALQEAASSQETLCVETQYVLEETDVVNHTVVETTWRLPDKYIGMNREQFLEAMDNYEAFPPLSELERGFIGLEVLAFSRERVVVQMNYRYVQPSASFYLGVYDNEVIVYLEDLETVYIETDIRLDTLPEQMQREIIGFLWVEDEETLYNFLENYSS